MTDPLEMKLMIGRVVHIKDVTIIGKQGHPANYRTAVLSTMYGYKGFYTNRPVEIKKGDNLATYCTNKLPPEQLQNVEVAFTHLDMQRTPNITYFRGDPLCELSEVYTKERDQR